MANRLLRNIAVTIGAGLAAGIGMKLASRRSWRTTPNLSPILGRLDNIEGRVLRVELAPPASARQTPEEIAALGTLVSSQSEDIASLHQDITRVERRNTERVEAFGQKVALLEQQMPEHIDANVTARIAELEQRLRSEFQDIHNRTVDAFADTIEKRVIGRITAIEDKLIAHSHSIASLREKSLKTDDHLQRMLEALEKLCARAEAHSPSPVFEARLPVLSTEPAADSVPPAPTTIFPNEPPALQAQADFASAPHERASRRESEPELEFAHAVGGRSDSNTSHFSSRGLKPVGMAILNLAVFGFRLIR